jgi:hypothetical protein
MTKIKDAEKMANIPTFICDGEILEISQIIEKKIVTSVTFAYLLKDKKTLLDPFKKSIREEKTAIIEDEKIGLILLEERDKNYMSIALRFLNTKELEKIDKNYDETIITQGVIKRPELPGIIIVPILNVTEMTWKNKK